MKLWDEVPYATLRLVRSEREIFVDEADYSLVASYRWFLSGHRYAARGETLPNGRRIQIYMHRFFLDPPKGAEVDHINGNGLDNRRANLRIATPAQNQWNSRVAKGVTGIRGVSFVPARQKPGKYHATIEVNKRVIHLGWFRDLETAAKARRAAELKYFGEFAPR